MLCPLCGAESFVRKDEHGFWIDCQGKHRPVFWVLPETSLHAIQKEEAKS